MIARSIYFADWLPPLTHFLSMSFSKIFNFLWSVILIFGFQGVHKRHKRRRSDWEGETAESNLDRYEQFYSANRRRTLFSRSNRDRAYLVSAHLYINNPTRKSHRDRCILIKVQQSLLMLVRAFKLACPFLICTLRRRGKKKKKKTFRLLKEQFIFCRKKCFEQIFSVFEKICEEASLTSGTWIVF